MDEAVALTWSTLTARLKNMRAGAICAGSGLATLIVAALVFRSGRLWCGLPLLAGVGWFFFLRDHKLVFAWEDRVLELWAQEKVVMGIFSSTFANNPSPLKRTLQAMVAHMPPDTDFLPPAPEVASAGRCLFWTRAMLQEARLHRGAALNLLLASLPLSIWAGVSPEGAWMAAALLPLALILPARQALLALSLRRWSIRKSALGPWRPEDPAAFSARLDGLDWAGMPRGLKRRVTGMVLHAGGRPG